jgi:sialate O-acetylesterase
VVTIDVGDANNMHPKNKKDVARRALLAAWKNVYHKAKDGDSPVYKGMEVSGGKVIVKIKNDGKRLLCKGDKINGFILAGKNMVFYRANAEMLSDNRIAVSSLSVAKPVAVRYAWADNPENCNIYNNNDMPLTPFRSDIPEKERIKK